MIVIAVFIQSHLVKQIAVVRIIFISQFCYGVQFVISTCSGYNKWYGFACRILLGISLIVMYMPAKDDVWLYARFIKSSFKKLYHRITGPMIYVGRIRRVMQAYY